MSTTSDCRCLDEILAVAEIRILSMPATKADSDHMET
jgi:hypothetical protein